MGKKFILMGKNFILMGKYFILMGKNIILMGKNIILMCKNYFPMRINSVPIKKNGAKRAKKRGGIYQQHSLRSWIACSIRSTSKVNRSECFNTIFLLRFMF